MVKSLLVAGLLSAATVVSAADIPWLQLDIVGGYRGAHDVIIKNPEDGLVTMYALLNIPANISQNQLEDFLADEWYISAAILPRYETETDIDLGYFTINDQIVNVNNEGMDYGVPPSFDLDDGSYDIGDLPLHENIFPTFYNEYAFSFSEFDNAQPYDTRDIVGIGPDFETDGRMYYKAFTIDISNLHTRGLHFDAYSKKMLTDGDVDVFKKNVFSHDATVLVPEPTMLSLFGFSLLLLVSVNRRKKLK